MEAKTHRSHFMVLWHRSEELVRASSSRANNEQMKWDCVPVLELHMSFVLKKTTKIRPIFDNDGEKTNVNELCMLIRH